MRIRQFISVFLLVSIAAVDAIAQVRAIRLRQSGVEPPATFSRGQETFVWCWAACTEMAFRAHGVRVTQREILTHLDGFPNPRPGTPDDVVRAMTYQGWDSSGTLFTSSAIAFAANDISVRQQLVIELAVGNPVIAFYNQGGQIGHVELIVGVIVDEQTLEVLQYTTLDPWHFDATMNSRTGGKAVLKRWDGPTFQSVAQVLVFPVVTSTVNARRVEQQLALRERFLAAAFQQKATSEWPWPDDATGNVTVFEAYEDAAAVYKTMRLDQLLTSPISPENQPKEKQLDIFWTTPHEVEVDSVEMERKFGEFRETSVSNWQSFLLDAPSDVGSLRVKYRYRDRDSFDDWIDRTVRLKLDMSEKGQIWLELEPENAKLRLRGNRW